MAAGGCRRDRRRQASTDRTDAGDRGNPSLGRQGNLCRRCDRHTTFIGSRAGATVGVINECDARPRSHQPERTGQAGRRVAGLQGIGGGTERTQLARGGTQGASPSWVGVAEPGTRVLMIVVEFDRNQRRTDIPGRRGPSQRVHRCVKLARAGRRSNCFSRRFYAFAQSLVSEPFRAKRYACYDRRPGPASCGPPAARLWWTATRPSPRPERSHRP